MWMGATAAWVRCRKFCIRDCFAGLWMRPTASLRNRQLLTFPLLPCSHCVLIFPGSPHQNLCIREEATGPRFTKFRNRFEDIYYNFPRSRTKWTTRVWSACILLLCQGSYSASFGEGGAVSLPGLSLIKAASSLDGSLLSVSNSSMQGRPSLLALI